MQKKDDKVRKKNGNKEGKEREKEESEKKNWNSFAKTVQILA